MSVERITQELKRGNLDSAAELMIKNSRAFASDEVRNKQSEKKAFANSRS